MTGDGMTESEQRRVAENRPLYLGSFPPPIKIGQRCGLAHCSHVPLTWEFDVAGHGRLSIEQGESAIFIANERLEWVRQ